ncbi:MAG: ABC transporter permease [Bacteroidales bacterium]|nr:ABC transporter permease [Bacteroidales bacterium]
MREAFKRPQNSVVFFRRLIFEMKALGIDSIFIVLIISVFVGAAIVIQIILNINGPMYPNWVYGFASRKAIILELAPTIISLILAGKCASRIASELGTQRITEQIDALEVMGVNTASYLILPKIAACLIFFPLLMIISIFSALTGGLIGALPMGVITYFDYVEGIRLEFSSGEIVYAMVKATINALIISSIACYRGYTLKGGSVEVGQESTKAIVQSSIFIMIFNILVTSLFN